MSNIPIIRNLVQLDENGEPELTREEMVLRIRELEYRLNNLEEDYEELVARYNDRGQEVTRLAEYRDGLEQFNRDKEAFDILVASQDPRSFVEFYRNIYPENADRIYAQFLSANMMDREMRQFLNTFAVMEEDRAAEILEEMMGTEIDLVVDILRGINTESSAAILGAMQTENAARLAWRMSPS
jgi:flagellar motility protein MotE (MotC chaperone)